MVADISSPKEIPIRGFSRSVDEINLVVDKLNELIKETTLMNLNIVSDMEKLQERIRILEGP